MLVYVGIFAILAAIALNSNNRARPEILLLIAIFLLWFMGWRQNVGCDFSGYFNRYKNIPAWFDPFDVLDGREAGFRFLTAWLKVNGFSYRWLNITASLIMLIAYGRYLRVSWQPITEIALLFPILILQLSMSGLRQGIAVAMLTAACAEFVEGRRAGTAVWIVLAFQFHTSAIMFLPMALLAGRSMSLGRLAFAVALLMPVAIYLMGAGFDDYTDQYVRQVSGGSTSDGALPRYLLILLPALFFWRFRERFAEAMPQWYPLFQIFSLGTLFVAPVFLVSSLVVHRVTFYLMPASIFLLASAPRVLRSEYLKHAARLAPFALYGVYLIGWLCFSSHARACYIPYNSYSFAWRT